MEKVYGERLKAGSILSAGLVLLVQAMPAQAQDVYLNSSVSGYLDQATIWQSGVVPVTGDNVYLTADTANATLFYRYNYDGCTDPGCTDVPVFSYLSVENTGGGTTTLRTSTSYPNGDLSADTISIGTSGSGAMIQTGGGTVSSATLILGGLSFESGYFSYGTGSYQLSGTGTLSANEEYIGRAGTGTFTQSSATNKVTAMYLGKDLGADGTYTMTGGNLSAFNEFIGYSGTGSFTQSGGTNSITAGMFLGYDSTGNGSYTMTGGTLQSTNGNIYVGHDGSGDFIQSGGLVDLGSGDLSVGENQASDGSYHLSGTGTLLARVEHIGRSGTGSFTQFGGINSVIDTMYLGTSPTGDGSYTMTGGTLQASDGLMHIAVGYDGSGAFIQSGGMVDLGSGGLVLGAHQTSNGSYQLSGTGTLLASSEMIGLYGTGSFTQSGGTNSVTSTVFVGYSSDDSIDGGDGSYTMTGGTLQASDGAMSIGVASDGRGEFDQSGGVVDLGGGGLYVGQSYGIDDFDPLDGDNSYQLSGTGTLLANVELIGFDGNGSFIQSGGINSVIDTMYLGNGAADGSYTMTGGTLQASDDGMHLQVGYYGSGEFIQSGGAVDLGSGILTVGSNQSSDGSYHLSGNGTLSAYREYIGNSGAGSFTQSGGSNTVIDSMLLGLDVNSTGYGSYTMTGGTLQASDGAMSIYVGYASSGEFTQSGGQVDLGGGDLVVGEEPASDGSYQLSGTGILSAYREYIGNSGTGNFTQSGGTNLVTQSMYVGANSSGGDGSYTMTGGTLQASDDGMDLEVGRFGSGEFTHSGGIVALGSGELKVGSNSLSDGSYQLSGTGILSAYREYIGNSGTGSFTQSGGTNVISDTLYIAWHEGSSGTYNLQGGTLSAASIDSKGSFTQSGGTLDAGTFDNRGSFNYSGGVFDGYLHLYEEGSFSQSSGTTFAAADGVTNDDSLSIYSGSAFNANGSGLVNNNTVSLYGGMLGGDGQLTNYGRISGYGAIAGSGGMVNFGYLEQTGDLTISNTGTTTNNMFVNLSKNFLNLTGGDFENRGTIAMDESIVNGSSHLYNRAGGVIQGDGLINTAFSNEGSLVVAGMTGISRDFTNSGVVEMAAATASMHGGAIDNQGTIHGNGQVGNDISNSGRVEAVNGILTLNGMVSNATSGQLSAGSGSKLLMSQGLAANNGKISLMGGTVDNGGHSMTNNGQITGYGTLRTGGLTNNNKVLLAGGPSTVDGSVTNASAGSIEVAYGHAIFNDDVVNDGLFKTTEASVSFVGDFTNNGTYFSDPSINTFSGDYTVNASGDIVGGEGDVFQFLGDFYNSSEQNESWNTREARIEFLTGTDNIHNMTLAGGDLGANLGGFVDNFAWGLMDIAANILNLGDGNSESGAAFYVGGVLGLDISGDAITNIIGNGYNIYYLAGLDENGYLGGLNYDLQGGGQLIAVSGDVMPTPIPGAIWLFGSAIFAMAGYRRKQLRGSISS